MSTSRRQALAIIQISWWLGTFELCGADVLTQRNDNFRSGLNLAETNLTIASLQSPGLFRKLYVRLLDANAYAQPLYVADLEIHRRRHDLIFVATENNTVYAFDDDPREKSPHLPPWWRTNLGPSIPVSELNRDIVGLPPGCTDLTPSRSASPARR